MLITLDSLPLWLQALIVLILLCFSAFFSISETSIMAVNRLKIRHLATHNTAAKRLLHLLNQIEDTLSVILIGNNLLNTLVTVLVTTLAVNAFGNNQWVLSVTTALISCLIILFCEIIPKVLGATYSEVIALSVASILRILAFIFKPLIILINVFITQLFKFFNISTMVNEQISIEEIKMMVLENHHLNKKQQNIVHDFLSLSDVSINEMMTPKSKIEALNLQDDIEAIIEQITSSYHNKLLVYDGDLNQILGILHIRKVIGILHKTELTKSAIQEALLPPYFIPENIKASQQLEHFQTQKKRLGVIVNEYGEIKGLITLEDILEQMVGEFTTSTPKKEAFVLQKDGSYILEASVALRDLEKYLKITIDHKAATINGLLLEELGLIPQHALSFKWENLVFEVLQSDDFSIKTVRLYRFKNAQSN